MISGRSAALAAAAICVAAAAFAWKPGAAPNENGRAAGSPAELAALREALDRIEEEQREARAAREALAIRLDEVAQELRAETPAPAPQSETLARGRSAEAVASSSPPRFDAGVLRDAGFAEREIATFRARLDDIALERLYLRDRATRENWLGTPRYAEESRALSDQLRGVRDEFGDDFYDWTLYAAGRPNRVAIVEVMQGSAAAEAGLEPGDRIVAYAGRRVFGALELREQTTAGIPGEATPVEVGREGDRIQAYVPRGPLGVVLEPSLEEPPLPR